MRFYLLAPSLSVVRPKESWEVKSGHLSFECGFLKCEKDLSSSLSRRRFTRTSLRVDTKRRREEEEKRGEGGGAKVPSVPLGNNGHIAG